MAISFDFNKFILVKVPCKWRKDVGTIRLVCNIRVQESGCQKIGRKDSAKHVSRWANIYSTSRSVRFLQLIVQAHPIGTSH